ncbi:TrkA-N domain dehydrogenase [Thozetella sp. PMI_491]|nr:TrkA-N domain dehydrogenase [Thozetella sp. PMI_491]
MRLFLLGGSGRTGVHVISEAIAQGHSVVALVRKETSVAAQPGLTTVIGSALSKSDVDAAFASAVASGPIDAVITTLNPRRVSDSPFADVSPDSPPTMLTDSGKYTMEAMQKYGVRKFVVQSTLGAGDSWKSLNFIARMLFSKSNMKHALADHNGLDAAVRSAAKGGSIDFVLARPAELTDEEAKEVKIFGDKGAGVSFMPKVSRKSVAKFLVRAAGSDEWNGKAPTLQN